MSEQNHTPEPWSYQASIPEDGFECFFINGKSKRISDFDGPQDEEQFANVRRIIYCVNALEGLSDHALIGGWTFRGIEAFAKGLEKQRDELLALLVEFSEALPSDKYMEKQGQTPGPLLQRIRSAIASVKANTQ